MPVPQQLGEHRHHRGARRHRPHAQVALQIVVHQGELVAHGVAVGDHPPGPFGDPPAFRREAVEALAPAHDGDPELKFQLLDAV